MLSHESKQEISLRIFQRRTSSRSRFSSQVMHRHRTHQDEKHEAARRAFENRFIGSGGFSLIRQYSSSASFGSLEINTSREWERSWPERRKKCTLVYKSKLHISSWCLHSPAIFINRLFQINHHSFKDFSFFVLWSHTDDVVDWRVHVFGSGVCPVMLLIDEDSDVVYFTIWRMFLYTKRVSGEGDGETVDGSRVHKVKVLHKNSSRFADYLQLAVEQIKAGLFTINALGEPSARASM